MREHCSSKLLEGLTHVRTAGLGLYFYEPFVQGTSKGALNSLKETAYELNNIFEITKKNPVLGQNGFHLIRFQSFEV